MKRWSFVLTAGVLSACIVSAMVGTWVGGRLWPARGIDGPPATSAVSHRQASTAAARATADDPAAPAARDVDSLLPLVPVRRPETPELTPEEAVHVAVYDHVNTSVVHINTTSVRADNFFMVEVPDEGSGSGSVLDTAGHILTNFHVVEGAREIQVTLFDGKTYEAELVGADPPTDIAVIRISAPPESLHPVVFGDSTRLRVGQRVYAIGNPFGLERTLTTGIISSLNRTLPTRNHRTVKSVIQIDAAINPGNSGGPLLDTHSRLIGMNTAIASRTGQSSGVGFAISSATIARIVPQLLQAGRVLRPDIGIEAAFRSARGLLIARLTPGGPAERAGLQGPRVIRQRRGPLVFESIDRSAADLVVAVDHEPVKTVDDFLTRVESHRPGETVILTVERDGQAVDVPVVLGSEGEVES